MKRPLVIDLLSLSLMIIRYRQYADPPDAIISSCTLHLLIANLSRTLIRLRNLI